MMTVSTPSAPTWTTSPLSLMRLPPYQPGPPLPLTGASLWPWAMGGGGGTHDDSAAAGVVAAPCLPASSSKFGSSFDMMDDVASESVEWEGMLNGSENARLVLTCSTWGSAAGVARESDRRERIDRRWCEMTSGRVGGRGGTGVVADDEWVPTRTSVSELRMPAEDGDSAGVLNVETGRRYGARGAASPARLLASATAESTNEAENRSSCLMTGRNEFVETCETTDDATESERESSCEPAEGTARVDIVAGGSSWRREGRDGRVGLGVEGRASDGKGRQRAGPGGKQSR